MCSASAFDRVTIKCPR
ncbi:Com family DNA-binding transcriptional regulator [Xanthomonas prunicola]